MDTNIPHLHLSARWLAEGPVEHLSLVRGKTSRESGYIKEIWTHQGNLTTFEDTNGTRFAQLSKLSALAVSLPCFLHRQPLVSFSYFLHQQTGQVTLTLI